MGATIGATSLAVLPARFVTTLTTILLVWGALETTSHHGPVIALREALPRCDWPGMVHELVSKVCDVHHSTFDPTANLNVNCFYPHRARPQDYVALGGARKSQSETSKQPSLHQYYDGGRDEQQQTRVSGLVGLPPPAPVQPVQALPPALAPAAIPLSDDTELRSRIATGFELGEEQYVGVESSPVLYWGINRPAGAPPPAPIDASCWDKANEEFWTAAGFSPSDHLDMHAEKDNFEFIDVCTRTSPGLPEGADGLTLSSSMCAHARRLAYRKEPTAFARSRSAWTTSSVHTAYPILIYTFDHISTIKSSVAPFIAWMRDVRWAHMV